MSRIFHSTKQELGWINIVKAKWNEYNLVRRVSEIVLVDTDVRVEEISHGNAVHFA
jgi:hypothetical protein